MGKKQKYHDNLFCKVFCKLFNMKEIAKELNYGKQEILSKRFVSFKTKDTYSKDGVSRDLKRVIENLIEENVQLVLDTIQDSDPMVKNIKMDSNVLIEKVFDISITQKCVQISMEK